MLFSKTNVILPRFPRFVKGAEGEGATWGRFLLNERKVSAFHICRACLVGCKLRDAPTPLRKLSDYLQHHGATYCTVQIAHPSASLCHSAARSAKCSFITTIEKAVSARVRLFRAAHRARGSRREVAERGCGSLREGAPRSGGGVLAPNGRRYFTLEAVPIGACAALGAKGRNLMGKKRRFLPKADCRFSPLGLLPLAIPSTPPLSVRRSFSRGQSYCSTKPPSSAVASVATLRFAHSAWYDPTNGALHIRLGHTATKAVAFVLRLVHEAVYAFP